MSTRRRITLEIIVVLAVSVGAVAVRALFQLAVQLSRPMPLNQQSTRLTPTSWTPNPVLDLLYQSWLVLQPLSWVALALFMLATAEPRVPNLWSALGLDRRWSSFGWGTGLALAVGIIGLTWYSLSVWLGINTVVRPTAMTASATQYFVYVLSSLENAIVEEVIVVGYLFIRLCQLEWTPRRIVIATALLRGAYHLYQGFGGFVGNLVMGLLFGWLYLRYKRLTPLIVAHAVIDLLSFFGASLLLPHLDWLQKLPGLS